MRSWNTFFALAADLFGTLLAPDRCAACQADVKFRTVFCRPCVGTLVRVTEEGSDDAASFVYGGAVAEAVTRFKYGRHPELARPLSTLLLQAATRFSAVPPDLVIPVPLHPLRLAERGFNQSALLAGPVARALGSRFEARALVRVRNTESQASLDRAARFLNVAHSFAVRRSKQVEGGRVLLVDDVRTTGATLRACADVLRAAGACKVLTAVVAQAAA